MVLSREHLWSPVAFERGREAEQRRAAAKADLIRPHDRYLATFVVHIWLVLRHE